jgi:undecaprenyl-phosphate galactose phosphotransferase/putative colanic acid biosynthesis UDP-glucose lipid carrier transferase
MLELPLRASASPYAGIRRSPGFISYRTVGAYVAALDFVLIAAASVIAGIGYHLFLLDRMGDVAAFAGIGLNSALLFVLLTHARGLYRTPALLSIKKQLRGAVIAWAIVLLAITGFFFLLKIGENYSRGAAIGFGFLGFGLLLGLRAITAAKLGDAVATGALRGRSAVIIGDAVELAHVSMFDFLRKYGALECARFELPPSGGGDFSPLKRELDAVDAAVEFARANNAEKIMLALPWNDTARRNAVCERLRALPLPVFLLPDRSVSSILAQPTREMGTQLAIELQRAPLSRIELATKRAMDVALAAATLVLLSPLLMAVSAAIKLDSRGPVVFLQRRKGFSGNEFTIYKFRTMTVAEDGAVVRQARRDDERVTRLGRLLRATSIDELPQLINVLSGDMSLVGPRPHALAHHDEYGDVIANYAFRHHVKPGITGWAQVNGLRGETAELDLMRKRVDLDLWYVNNWSVWLDLWIIFRTCIELARGRNAY